jgi:hypothetical protein
MTTLRTIILDGSQCWFGFLLDGDQDVLRAFIQMLSFLKYDEGCNVLIVKKRQCPD